MPRTKLSPISIWAAFMLSGLIVRAQEPPLPAATETPAPNASARPQLNIPEIPMAVEPSPLIPSPQIPSSPAVPKKPVPPLSELDAAFQKTPLGQVSEEYRLHVEWRQLQNRASLDPEVIAAKAEIKNARTDLEKRDYTRAYYRIFYARMQSLASAPDLKAYLEGKKKAILDSLAQPRVHPEPTARPPSSR
jgi:hypothetical protein